MFCVYDYNAYRIYDSIIFCKLSSFRNKKSKILRLLNKFQELAVISTILKILVIQRFYSVGRLATIKFK